MSYSMLRSLPAAFGILILALAAPVASASAQDDGAARSFRLVVDNDLFAVHTGHPDDHDYTHGTRLIASAAGAPGWLRALFGGARACDDAAARRTGCLASSLEIAQEIYTPRIDGLMPVPGERPYSGWLAASGSMHFVTGERVRSLRVEVGVTGPPSLAEQAQDGIHAIFGQHERRGWARQLDRGAGFSVAVDERAGLVRQDSGRYVGSIALEYGAMAGTIRTAAHVGLRGRLGVGSRPTWSAADLVTSPWRSVYLITDARQYFVYEDLFVEGNADYPGAARLPMVQEATFGIGVRRGRLALEYRHVLRGREYEAQTSGHAYGSFGITVEGM